MTEVELYPVQNDYPDEFKIPPANRINNPGAQTLYPASTGFEKALADTDAERLMDMYAEAIIDEWNPWQVAYEHLPFLASAQGVNLWEDWWDETFKRNWTARQWYLKSIRGKRAGLDEFVTAVGGHVKRCVVPPATAFGTKAQTDAERAAYVARFPQLRIYPYVARELLPWLCYNGKHYDGTGLNRVWNKNGSFLGPRRRVYPTVQDAGGKYTRTAELYEPRTGIETKLTIRRIVNIDMGPGAGWGFTPGVSQYDESVILPLLHRPNYFCSEPRKYLGVNIYLGAELPLRTISIGRSGPMELTQAKAQYQTTFPQAELLQIRPEYISIPHPRRKTELYAARGEYLIRAKSIVTHAVASDCESGSPSFGRVLMSQAAGAISLSAGHPILGAPVMLQKTQAISLSVGHPTFDVPVMGLRGPASLSVGHPTFDAPVMGVIRNVSANSLSAGHPVLGAAIFGGGGALDVATQAWVSNVQTAGGSVSPARQTLIDNMIVGLKADGIWTKLDRLWIYAAENPQSALRDLKTLALSTATSGTPGFTPNLGYAVFQRGAIVLSLSYNPTTDGVAFSQNSAHLACWNMAEQVAANDVYAGVWGTTLGLYNRYSGDLSLANINASGAALSAATSTAIGFLLGNRSGASAVQLYRNGVSVATAATASAASPNQSLELDFGTIGAVSIGGSLTSTDQLALYNRLSTYMIAVGAVDVDATAWAAAVVTAGGSVSSGRQSLVNQLIAGLKTDGIWAKLDRLWMFAAENATSALIDLKGRTTASLVNTPTFAANRGYKGNGSSAYIDTGIANNFGGNYTQNSACLFGWSNTVGLDGGPLVGTGPTVRQSTIVPAFTDGSLYAEINYNSGGWQFLFANAGATGLYVANRTASLSSTIDLNGSQIAIDTTHGATPLTTDNFTALVGLAGTGYSNRQIPCMGFGGGLTAGDRTALYNRLRTYMTAVGVP